MSSFEKISVLIVDDNTRIRDLLVGIMRSAGVERIAQAENGREAWEILCKSKFDLVMTDWMMPEMSGLELLKKIRGGDQTQKNTPVMMITASDNSNDIVAAAKWKVNGYIVKPFKVQTVLEKISKVIGFKK